MNDMSFEMTCLCVAARLVIIQWLIPTESFINSNKSLQLKLHDLSKRK